MSYCRFSTDDFTCDLYCYESDAGFETHVAAYRVVYPKPLPPPVDLFEDPSRWFKRHDKVLGMLKSATKAEIGLPYDGERFTDPTRQEFLERLLKLKEVGYRFPAEVIDLVREGL